MDAGQEFLWLTLTPETSDSSSTSSTSSRSSESASPSPEAEPQPPLQQVVVLVDTFGKGGSSLARQIDHSQAEAEGMRIRVGLICIGSREGRAGGDGDGDVGEGTWLVVTLDEVVPRF